MCIDMQLADGCRRLQAVAQCPARPPAYVLALTVHGRCADRLGRLFRGVRLRLLRLEPTDLLTELLHLPGVPCNGAGGGGMHVQGD